MRKRYGSLRQAGATQNPANMGSVPHPSRFVPDSPASQDFCVGGKDRLPTTCCCWTAARGGFRRQRYVIQDWRSKVLMRDLAGLCGICGMPTHTTLTRVHNVAGSPPVAAPMEVGDERGAEYCGEIGRIYLTFDMYSPIHLAGAHRGETGSLGTAPTATQSRRCSRSGIALGQPQICPWILGAFSGRGRGGGETRCVRRGVASGVRAIVSRARFRGPGWERREPLPGHPVRVPPGDRFAPDHRPGGRG